MELSETLDGYRFIFGGERMKYTKEIFWDNEPEQR